MSTAREHENRLIRAAELAMAKRWGDEHLVNSSDAEVDAGVALEAFLARPDDLLAVLVDAGVLELAGWKGTKKKRSGLFSPAAGGVHKDDEPLYRRTRDGV